MVKIVLISVVTLALCWSSSSGANLRRGFLLLQENTAASSRVYEDTILKALECLRGKLGEGIPEIGLPPLDPLEIQEGTIDLDALGIPDLKGYIRVRDLVLAGTTKWEVTKIKGTIGIFPPRYTVTMTLNFPLVTFTAGYDLDVEYLQQKIYGEGSVAFEMVNFSVDVDARLRVLGGVALDYFHVVPRLERLKSFEITGLMGDEALSDEVSKIIAANAPQILDGVADDVDRILGGIIVDAVNNGGGGDGPITEILAQCLQ